MKEYTQKQLIEEGYEILNVKIASVDLSMEDHGCLVLAMGLEMEWGYVTYGGYALGYNDVFESESFKGNSAGIEYIMNIMSVIGCERFNNLKGKYARIAYKHGEIVKIIGNIIDDAWFDAESFFEDKKGKEENGN